MEIWKYTKTHVKKYKCEKYKRVCKESICIYIYIYIHIYIYIYIYTHTHICIIYCSYYI